MSVFRIEIMPNEKHNHRRQDEALAAELREAGLSGLTHLHSSRLIFIEGELERSAIEELARELLIDPITERAAILQAGDEIPKAACDLSVEIHLKPGVMDPVAESTLTELRAAGRAVAAVRTARRYELFGKLDPQSALRAVNRVTANDCIENAILGAAPIRPAPQPPIYDFQLRHVPIRRLDEQGLRKLSRDGHLFLSAEEMRALQAHFQSLGRDPTDLELETLAQTWSEHCVHKTLKSAVEYRGAPFGIHLASNADISVKYENLLKDTIVRATRELTAEGRGPECLSVFEDNAGVIGFDERFGIAFKVETHNHPSAIEPYGGAATGIGGVIRDVLGCGLGARPIANTDVFCVAPTDWPQDRLPKGVLHPRRILRGIVKGVSDYGNRMGIPTVNGAVFFEPRYLGNPLVYCGCVGIIPRDKIHKAARPGDRVVVIGGRTGRDGIHGATFSSAELTDTHADEFSHAVQIGNAITEKRCLDALLRARDYSSGCLYHAVTDCGAGGLSSAVGEMGEATGAVVDLDDVPLKYAGLRYDEIWISEAQERMVFAVPTDRLETFLAVMREEEVEATVIGTFGSAPEGKPRLTVRHGGVVVGDLDMDFLHHGVPKRHQIAEWQPSGMLPCDVESDHGVDFERLERLLASPNVASKEWIIRTYDHEVQGGSVLKPLAGPGIGPGDAAVLRPLLDGRRGIALGCGNAAHLAELDPYWAAAASIDEALRNVVCVGADPRKTAILDNFCWGRCDEPRQMGTLVRACQACYDAAKAYGTPFISGKDSLNNEYALHAEDVENVLAVIERYARSERRRVPDSAATYGRIAGHVRDTQRLRIPGTLLISALGIVEDVARCVSPDLKESGNAILLVGGLPQVGYSLADAARTHHAVADAIQAGRVSACHDVGEGGWLVALAEMAFTGNLGVRIATAAPLKIAPDAELCAAYLIETGSLADSLEFFKQRKIRCEQAGEVLAEPALRTHDGSISIKALRAAWAGR